MTAMSKRTKVYGFLILVVVLAAAGYVLRQSPGPPTASGQVSPAGSRGGESRPVATPVELALARQDRITNHLSSTSNLRALREVEVTAQTGGIVQSLIVEEGDFVRQGQLLGRLDDRSLKIQLELAREKLAQAKLQLEKAHIRREKAKVQIANTENERQRLQEAYEEQLISEREYDQVRYQLDELGHDERVSASETRELFTVCRSWKWKSANPSSRSPYPDHGSIQRAYYRTHHGVGKKTCEVPTSFSSWEPFLLCMPTFSFGTGGAPGAARTEGLRSVGCG